MSHQSEYTAYDACNVVAESEQPVETEKKSLLDMKEGREGVVIEMLAESGMRDRLDNMGITVGTKLTKVNDSFLHGPVTVKFGNSQTALGYGMAEKIILEEPVIKKILLIGNPNGGKSMLFNRLTGANVLAANYPGSTVEYAKGNVTIADEETEVIDVPSTYSLKPTSAAEEIAVRMLAEGKPIIVNVIDSTNLERSLNLTLQLLKTRRPMLVALNLWDETKHTGVNIDVEKLEKTLGVPCVPTTAISGEGIKDLVELIPQAKISSYDFDDAERWHEVGNIVEAVQTITHKHHTFLEWLGDRSVRPLTGIPIAMAVLAGMFWAIWQIGEGLSSYLFEPLFKILWLPLMLKLSAALGGTGFLHDLLVGSFNPANIGTEKFFSELFGESFGLLTTGLFVPIGAILPYVFAFYLIMSFLEDCGYLPRLAVLTDTLMHRLGLHGMSIIPMLIGMGCNVPGVLAARIMESHRQRFITVLLMVISIPCMAQTARIVILAKGHPWFTLPMIFGTLFLVWLSVGLVARYVVRGKSPEILMNIPPYRIPYMRGLLKKLLMRMVWFLREAVPFVLLGVFIANLLYTSGIIEFMGGLLKPVVSGLLGLPPDAVGGLIIGFLRRDIAVGMLLPLNLSFRQVVVASVMLTIYFPCVATFAVMFKEFGLKGTLKALGLIVLISLMVGGLLNLVLSLAL